MTDAWKIRGELILSCNCDVFCPCVIALGKAKPTYGVCHTWWGLHIDEGHAGDESLDGLNVGVLMDIPGPLAEGNWSVALYIDERASDAAAQALTEILSGKAGGTTSWFTIMVAEFLGVKRVPIEFKHVGKGWSFKIPKRSPTPNTGWEPRSPSVGAPRADFAIGVATGNSPVAAASTHASIGKGPERAARRRDACIRAVTRASRRGSKRKQSSLTATGWPNRSGLGSASNLLRRTAGS